MGGGDRGWADPHGGSGSENNGRTGGKKEPDEAMVELRERRAKVEPMGRRGEGESRAQRLEVKPRDQHTRVEL